MYSKYRKKDHLLSVIEFNRMNQLEKNKYRPEMMGVNVLDELFEHINYAKDNPDKREKEAKKIIDKYRDRKTTNEIDKKIDNPINYSLPQYVDLLDDLADIIIWAEGGMTSILQEMGNVTDQDSDETVRERVNTILSIVSEKNKEKKGSVNINGKLEKDNFFTPANELIKHYLIWLSTVNKINNTCYDGDVEE